MRIISLLGQELMCGSGELPKPLGNGMRRHLFALETSFPPILNPASGNLFCRNAAPACEAVGTDVCCLGFVAAKPGSSLNCEGGVNYGTCLLECQRFSFLNKKILKMLFTFSEGKEGREGEKQQCARDAWIGHLSHGPYSGPGRQPRLVPQLGIEPVIFRFTGRHSIH